MLKWMFAHVCPSYPFWPGLGALLLKVRTALCLNLGGCFLISRGSNIRHYDWIAGGEKFPNSILTSVEKIQVFFFFHENLLPELNCLFNSLRVWLFLQMGLGLSNIKAVDLFN